MIQRDFTAIRLNEIINHPSVYPWVHGMVDGPLDMTPAVADRRNVLLMGAHGGIIFHHHAPGLYEAHSQCLPEGRGDWMLAFTHAALHWMFTCTDCVEVITRVPKGNLAARALTKAAHLTSRVMHPQGWTLAGKIVPAEVFGLTLQQWILTAPGLGNRGPEMGRKLKRQIGPGDDANNRHLAASLDMISGGQPEKGVVFFNRWAVMTDQPELSMLSRGPMAFQHGNVLIVFRASGDYYATGIDLQAAS